MTSAATAGDPVELDRAASLRLLLIMSRALDAVLRPALRPVEEAGLSRSEFAVLEALYHKGAVPLGQLASLILLQTGSTTYVVNQLVRRGLMVRRTCAEDRRVIFGELTPGGRSLVARVFARHAEALRRAMTGLTRQEKRQAADLLKRLGRTAAGLA